jgi:nitrogen-specific signal transduction histidine kinase
MATSEDKVAKNKTHEEKIPAEVARELRALAHDLSNSLETIIQATYLITQSGPAENQKRWVELIDQASQDAVRINNKLREIMRSRS